MQNQPPPGYPPMPPTPPEPRYSIVQVIFGGLAATFGFSSVMFHFQVDKALRDVHDKNPNLPKDGDVDRIMHTIGDWALPVGLILLVVGVLLIVTSKRKPKPIG